MAPGFSTSTWQPASSAEQASGANIRWGVATITKSTPGVASASSALVATAHPGTAAASFAAALDLRVVHTERVATIGKCGDALLADEAAAEHDHTGHDPSPSPFANNDPSIRRSV